MELVSFEEFKESMKYVMGEFTDKHLQDILDSVEVGAYDDSKEASVYADVLGMSIFADKNLHSVLAYFTNTGYEADEIIDMMSTRYGSIIDLHLCNDGMYVAIVG